MIAMRSGADPFTNLMEKPEDDKSTVLASASFNPRSKAELPVRPSQISVGVESEPAGPTLPAIKRASVPRLTTQGVLPPLRTGGDPFKAAGPVFLPPLQRSAPSPNASVQGFPPARGSVSGVSGGAPSGAPRRPTMTGGALPTLRAPPRGSRTSLVPAIPEVDEKKSGGSDA